MSSSNSISRIVTIIAVSLGSHITYATPPNLFEIAKQLDIFNTLFKEVQLNFVDETNPAELITAAITEMMATLDPYSVFMNEQDIEAARLRQETDQASIGARYKIVEKGLVLTEIYKSGAADMAGLKVGDVITAIDNIEVKDYRGDLNNLLSGPNGSEVILLYEHRANSHEVVLKRDNKTISVVPVVELLESGVGYTALTQFDQKAAFELDQAIRSLQNKGATGLILGLRGNPGGLLGQAIDIVNFFVPRGELVVSTQSNLPSQNKVYVTKKDPIAEQLPVVILVNGRSASASEIVAGALQDLDRAVGLGARSFGKGLVQQQKPLVYGTQFKITISRYFTPSGRCIQSLDYRNRDDNGEATKRDETAFQSFTTKNGRPVFDGGGVLPDLLIPEESTPNILRTALEQGIIFEFISSISDLSDYLKDDKIMISEGLFNQFLDWAQIKTPSEQVIKDLEESIHKDGLSPDMDYALAQIKKNLNKAIRKQIISAKTSFKREMAYDIALRLFYKEGLFLYKIKNDPAIIEANKLLVNSNQYYKYLGH